MYVSGLIVYTLHYPQMICGDIDDTKWKQTIRLERDSNQ